MPRFENNLSISIDQNNFGLRTSIFDNFQIIITWRPMLDYANSLVAQLFENKVVFDA